jgi:predicted dehydrogenase
MSRILIAAGALVDQIKINALSREWRDGRSVWIKRRRWTAGPIMACANHFFHLAGNPIRAITETALWQSWEVDCFLRLHGEQFHAFADGARAVAAEELPGQTLSQHLENGTLTPQMLTAAAIEMRRAHAVHCSRFSGCWSHGDPHTGNFVYDATSGRARLIDFEVMHHPQMPAGERHVDDVLILLQDLAGRISTEQWLPCAQAFLAAYGSSEIAERLRHKLVVPHGLARVWWAVRTTYLAPVELMRRIVALRESL